MRMTFIVLGMLCAVSATAQIPQIDYSYGDSGIAWTGDPTHSMSQRASAMCPDGSVVIGGVSYPSNTPQPTYDRAIVARFLPDGSLDQNFGPNGMQRPGNGPHNAYLQAIGVNSSGTIICGMHTTPNGLSQTQAAVVAMLPNGSLDTTFADSGQFIAPANVSTVQHGFVDHLVVLPDDRILINTIFEGHGLWRLTEHGVLDSSFGQSGYIDLYTVTGRPMALEMIVDGSGRILILTSSSTGSPMVITRLDTAGQIDHTFGNNGKLILPTGTNIANGNTKLAAWPTGEIIVTLNDIDLNEIHLVKYTSTGELDTYFAVGGVKVVPYLQGNTYGGMHTIGISPTGKILAVFSAYNHSNGPYITEIHSIYADGSMDQSHGTNGVHTVIGHDTWHDNMIYKQIHFEGSGNYILAGTRAMPGLNYFMARRFLTELSVSTNDLSAKRDPLVYPNPINSASTFVFQLQQAGSVSLELLDMRGALVHTVIPPGTLLASGEHSAVLDLPSSLAIGPYLLTLQTFQGTVSIQVLVR